MNSAQDSSTIRKPVIHHLHELQKRLTWSILAVIAGAGIAYSVHMWLFSVIQRPLNETLYYTSPMGGFNFLVKLCLVVGLVLALPVILYQFFSFLGPLLKKKHKLTITAYTLWSFDLACLGILFAYFVSLPSALHFLSQFGGSNVQSLITVDEYFNFALAYIVGFALMFQVPLVVLFINRIKPLRPSKMMGAQRYIILFSFIAAAILTPTPDPVNQAIMALPAILLYQVGIVLVWLVNRGKPQATSSKVAVARKVDSLQSVHNKPTLHDMPLPGAVQSSAPQLAAPAVISARSERSFNRAVRRNIDGFIIRPNNQQAVRNTVTASSLPGRPNAPEPV